MSTDKLAESASNTVDAVTNSSTAKSLDTALASMIDSSVRNAGDAVAWTKEQIPDVLNQLLKWELISSVLIFSTLILIGIVCFVISMQCRKLYIKATADYEARKRTYTDRKTQWGLMERLPYGSPGRDEAFSAYLNTSPPDTEDHGGYAFLGWVSGGLSTLFLWRAMYNLEWLQILVAPKVYLLEYAAELLKS